MGKRRPHNQPKVKEIPKEAKIQIIMHTIQEYNKHMKTAMRANKVGEDRADTIIIEAISRLSEAGE